MRKVKIIILIGVTILVCIVFLNLIKMYDRNLHIVICDVGQGDSIFIRTPQRYEILIDGGPNTQVLDCLSNHLPFWDRKITMVMLTHPHYDHFRGLIDVLQRYDVSIIGREDLDHKSSAYSVFTSAIEREETNNYILERGRKLEFSDGVVVNILGPDKEFIEEESPNGVEGSDNPPSLIIQLTFGRFNALFPGDSDGQDIEHFVPYQSSFSLLALPHHGSENGFTTTVSDHITTQLAVASSGKNNRYGHPHTSVLGLLKDKNIPVLRTDQSGSIHIIIGYDGKVHIDTEK